MVNVTIDNLLDGEAIQTSASRKMIQQGGISYKVSNRPNTVNQINVTSQAQLEAELGVDLIIPDGENIKVVYDDEFTQTKPFKIGSNSILEVTGGKTITVITYTGVSAMFQNVNPANPISSLVMENLTINGSTTGTLFDVIASSFIFIKLVEAQDFVSRGIIGATIVKIRFMGKLRCGTGLVIKNTSEIRIIACPHFPPTINDITDISIIYDGSPLGLGTSSVIIDDNNSFFFNSTQSLFFLDPNPPPGSSYIIENCSKSTGELFQPGTDIVIVDVVNNGGKAQFTTVSSHGLVVGKAFVLKDFFVETDYNQTAIVTGVDIPLTGTVIDTDIPFTAIDTGKMSAKSLDQKSPLVLASNNPGSPDSMTQGELRVKLAGIEVISSPVTPVPIEDLAPTASDFLPNADNELFSLDSTTGELEYIGLESKRGVPTYTIEATDTGPTQILEFALFRDSGSGYVEISDTRISFDTSVETSKSFSGTFFNMNPGDKFKLFKVSNTTANNTNINDGTKLMIIGG